MSILFDEATEAFEPEDAEFFSPGESDEEFLEPVDGDDVPVETIGEFAVRAGKRHPERDDWTVVPLHEHQTAELTGEYVAYVDHDVRGRIFLTREEDGELTDVDTHPVDPFGGTRLARRIRFWHSDHTPDDYPDYYTYPVDECEPPRKELNREKVVRGLKTYVEDEMNAQKEQNRERIDETLSNSPERYVEAFSEDRLGDDLFKFSFEVPEDRNDGFTYLVEEHDVHPDNRVLLAQPGEDRKPDDVPVEAVVEDVRGRKLTLRVDFDLVDDVSRLSRYLSKEGRGFRLAPHLNPLPYEREMTAVEKIEDSEKIGILAGEKELTFGDPRASEEKYDDELNQEQETAVRLSLLSDEMFCVHGPPGTGKTRALVEVVRRAANSGQRVLVCADSNQAVDNLLVGSSTEENPDEGSLHAYGQHGEDEFRARRVKPSNSDNEVVRNGYDGDSGTTADVVVSTNNAAARLPSGFDLAVLDEATQSTVVSSCIPISKAERFVLAGDHKQLPPYTASEGPSGSRYGGSLFEHLYADGGVYEGVGVQLRTQYRMHRDIMYFPNRRFYGGSLRCGHETDVLPDHDAVCGYDIGGEVVETASSSRYNTAEAKLVVVLVSRLLNTGLEPDEVAVITPYEAQRVKIDDGIGTRLSDEVGRRLSVDTVDSFQGGEREAVVISMVRSNEEGRVGFLGRPEDGPRRLNVAMTRAKRFCCVVGDWYTLTKDTDGKCSGLYQDLYSHLDDTGRIHDVDRELLETRLRSL